MDVISLAMSRIPIISDAMDRMVLRPTLLEEREREREKFMEGLNDEIALQLANAHAPTYQAMVDMAIVTEDKRHLVENCNRKYMLSTRNTTTPQ